jgi:hypothetical protein
MIRVVQARSRSIEQAIPLEEQAIRLSPRDPNIGPLYFPIGTVHLLQSRTDEAIVWLEKGRSAGPAKPFIRAELSAAYALGGDLDRAALELAKLGSWMPELFIRASPV